MPGVGRMLVTDFRLKYALYKIVLAAFQLYDTGRMHPVRERARRALERTVDYIEAKLPGAIGFDTQKELLAYALDAAPTEGHHLEFGVFKGQTLGFLAQRKPSASFHGFDSFEGLPEDWSGFNLTKRAFSRQGRMPEMPTNVTLHPGWFNGSVPAWAANHAGPIAFMHIDCDIYSSTVDILNALVDRLRPGSIIVFDEYFNYPNWEQHEYRAWQECVAAHGIRYEYIGYARQQAAVRILE